MESNMTKRFKIEPDLTCPELAGYKLPPCSRCQEDGVEIESEKYGFRVPYNGSNEFYDKDAIKHFKAGYHKAREKFEFSESQLRQALSMAFIAVQDGGNITSDEIIQSLRTPRTPIAIEVEYELDEFPLTNPDGTVKGVYVYE